MLTPLLISLALMGMDDTPPSGEAIFALFDRYRNAIEDVSFIYEGSTVFLQQREFIGQNDAYQGYYAYRRDGATLLDIFTGKEGGSYENRTLFSLLNWKMAVLEAMPDMLLPQRMREVEEFPGGPGSLARTDSPERIFFNWFFYRLASPAEHDCEVLGWDKVGDVRCVTLSLGMSRKSDLGNLPRDTFRIQLWVDLNRDAYPIRLEARQDGHLVYRTEVTNLHRLQLPNKSRLWFPMEGTTWTFEGLTARSGIVYTEKPVYEEHRRILLDTIKFNRKFPDGFFSVKAHAKVASNEGLERLLRELKAKAPTKEQIRSQSKEQDPRSVTEKLTQAIEKANEQSRLLEASSAAREVEAWGGWSPWWLSGLLGAALVVVGAYHVWRSR